MSSILRSRSTIADSAHELQRAAGGIQQRASEQGAVASLPVALAHVEEALDRLSTSMVKAAEAVQEWAGEPVPAALAPDARALRWHLYHLASRIRGAQEACPDARRWARELLRQADAEAEEPDAALAEHE
jgi:hypothetical protein